MNTNEYIKSKLRSMTTDEYVIEELTQIVNIIIVKRGYKNDNENKFKKLISLIARSVYVDYYRKRKNIINELLGCDLESNYRADDAINKKEDENLIAKILNELTENQRDAVILRYFFGISYKRIAQLMNCPFNTALGYVHGSKKKLKNLIK